MNDTTRSSPTSLRCNSPGSLKTRRPPLVTRKICFRQPDPPQPGPSSSFEGPPRLDPRDGAVIPLRVSADDFHVRCLVFFPRSSIAAPFETVPRYRKSLCWQHRTPVASPLEKTGQGQNVQPPEFKTTHRNVLSQFPCSQPLSLGARCGLRNLMILAVYMAHTSKMVGVTEHAPKEVKAMRICRSQFWLARCAPRIDG